LSPLVLLKTWVPLKAAPSISARVMPHAFGGDRMMTPRQAAGISVIVSYGGVFRPFALTAGAALREVRDPAQRLTAL